jgi:hypothetical protein
MSFVIKYIFDPKKNKILLIISIQLNNIQEYLHVCIFLVVSRGYSGTHLKKENSFRIISNSSIVTFNK